MSFCRPAIGHCDAELAADKPTPEQSAAPDTWLWTTSMGRITV
jgi:hypothetical protein